MTDRHLAARGFASHPERLAGGRRATLGFPRLVAGARPADFRRPPDLGQYNREIFLDLLGLDPERTPAMTSATTPVCVDVRATGPIARIMLNRPEKLNAINVQVGLQLYEAFARCESDSAIRATVLAGAGPCASRDRARLTGRRGVGRAVCHP